MKILEGANLGLRFLLELGAVAASAYWGWKTGDGVIRWVLTIAAPLAVIVVWALFVSPNPTIELARPLYSRSRSRCGPRPARRSPRPGGRRSGSRSSSWPSSAAR